MREPLLFVNENGLYCPAGDFYIDPQRRVRRAIVTHAHTDHARWGMESYLTAEEGKYPMRVRLGEKASIQTVPFGETLVENGVRVTLFPAGHILGSAQVLVEYKGERWVASGDYKTEPDETCTPFEPIRCDTFITESTFGLPIYRWAPQAEVFAEMNEWARANRAAGITSVFIGYALGKAQRILSGLDSTIAPIIVNGAIEPLNEAYRAAGVCLPETYTSLEEVARFDSGAPIVITPGASDSTGWLKKFGKRSVGFASGWMLLRKPRRGRSFDKGFALSDHADWAGLLGAIQATGAERVLVTHGFVAPLVRYLNETGVTAFALETPFADNEGEATDDGKAGKF